MGAQLPVSNRFRSWASARRRAWVVALLVATAAIVAACATRAEPPGAPSAALARWTGPATITDHAVTLTLERAPPTVMREALSRPAGALVVEITGLRADRPTGAAYNVFVGPRRGAAPAEVDDADYVGAFSLFDIAGRSDAAGKTLALNGGDRGRIGRLLTDPSQPLVLTITPRGGDGSPLVVGAVRLVRGP